MEAAPDLSLEAKRLYAEAASLGMWRYTPCEAYDADLARWWTYMLSSNEFPLILPDLLRPLSSFLAHFQPPTIPIFASKHNSIWFAAWFRPFASANSAAFVNHWCLPSMRGTKLHARCTYLTYTFATTLFPVLIGITKHEKLLRDLRLLGYNIVGQIPKFLEGEDTWITYLTKENFFSSRLVTRLIPRIRKE